MNSFTTSTKGTGDQDVPSIGAAGMGTGGMSTGGTTSLDVGASSTVGGKTTGYQINTDGTEDEGALVLDEELTPERQKELSGDIPKEKAQEPKDKSTLPDLKTPERTMTASLVPVTPLSIPVGDQSLGNMNARNRNFWRR